MKPACFIFLVAAVGCGSSTTPGPAVDGGDVPLGGFLINLVAAVPASETTSANPAFTSIAGKVYDGANPPTIIWQDKEMASGCTMKEVRTPFCSPGCGGSAACVADGQCANYPTGQTLGTVKVTGLGATMLTLTEVMASYQYPGELPYPPAAEGASIDLQAGGGKLGPFSLHSVGIVPLVVSDGPVPLDTGKPVSLTWTAPGKPELTRIQIKLDISHHGGTKAKIECDVPDTGALTIPAPLITRLFAVGFSGFPTIVLTRVAAGWASVPAGKISLQVVSSVERAIKIPGLVDCTEDTDCPSGMTCQKDLKCQ